MSREYTRLISVRGNVPAHGPFILSDDFEHLLKWTKGTGVGDSIFELDTSLAYSGNQCLHMKTRTTDAAEADVIKAYRFTYLLPSLRLNQIIHFSCPDFTKIGALYFLFEFYDGTHLHSAQIRFLPNTPLWQYTDSVGNPQSIPDSAYSLFPNTWHRLQLLADLNTHKYMAAIVDHHRHDLSVLLHSYAENPAATHYNAQIQFQTIGANPAELHLDDFLLHEL